LISQVWQDEDYAHDGAHSDLLLSLRSGFVGLKGRFSVVLFGANDKPIKKSQMRLDLFNDQISAI